MTKVSIVNVVATAALGRRVDLDELGKCPKILHDPDVYGGVLHTIGLQSSQGKLLFLLLER
jgi:TATA-box binding protein (TBP) (component of TFIID and TFIIIB)